VKKSTFDKIYHGTFSLKENKYAPIMPYQQTISMKAGRVYRLLLVLFFTSLYTHVITANTIIYVKTVASGTADGSSWVDATTLTDALNQANSSGTTCQLWVAAGTYLPTAEFDADNSGGSDVREKTFYLANNMEIYGGVTGTETNVNQRNWTVHKTIFSGDIGVAQNAADNAYHVVFLDGTTANGALDASCIIDGVYIQNGNASGSGIHAHGGGMLNDNASPTVENTWFSNNVVDSHGGAVYNDGQSSKNASPTFERCHFYENTASSGGGVFNNGFSGISNANFVNCAFANNVASSNGGAIFNMAQFGFSQLFSSTAP